MQQWWPLGCEIGAQTSWEERVPLSPCCLVPFGSHIIRMYSKLTLSHLHLLVTERSLAASESGVTDDNGGIGRVGEHNQAAVFRKSHVYIANQY